MNVVSVRGPWDEPSASSPSGSPSPWSPGIGGVNRGGAFDQALMDQEAALVADRDDNAGALAVGFAVDRFGLIRLDDLVAALFETRGFHHQIVAEFLIRQLAEFLKAHLDAVEFGGDLGLVLGRLRLNPPVLRHEAVVGVEHGFRPSPIGAQFDGLLFELLDREAVDERRLVQEAVVIAAEQVAGDPATGGFIGLDTDKEAEIGIERHRAAGQQPPYLMRRHIVLLFDLAPDRELRRMIGAERKGCDHLEAELAGAERVEQFRRELAELEALPDMPLGDAEAHGDGLDRDAAVDQRRHRGEFVGRVHRRAHRVLHQRGFNRGIGLFDQARHLAIACDRTFGGELLQRLEPPPAGGDGEALRLADNRANDQVLLQPASADAGLELGIFGCRCRTLADIGRGQDEMVEGDAADGRGGVVHG